MRRRITRFVQGDGGTVAIVAITVTTLIVAVFVIFYTEIDASDTDGCPDWTITSGSQQAKAC